MGFKHTSHILYAIFFLLTLGVGNAWGDSYSFNSSIPTTGWSTNGGNMTINNKQWSYSSSTYIGAQATRIQIGSKNNPQTSTWTIQIPISSFGNNKKVTEIAITAYTTATSATYDISAGGSSVKSGSLTTSSATYTASNLNISSGNIVVSLTGSSTSKAMYLSDISVTYETATAPSCTAPTITVQPTGASYNKDATPSALSVTATGTSLTYQWYSNTTNSTTGASSISGATSSSYTPSTATAGTKYYYCIVSSSTCTTTSNIVAVTVNVPVSSVSLNKTSTTIVEDQTETLTATVSPNDANNKTVNWSSDNTDVATVNSSGVVTAVVAGTATITATSAADNTKSASCTVTVTAAPRDHFVDLVQSTEIADKKGAYSTPTIADKTAATSGTCEQQHYHFVGWITAAKYEAGTAIADGDLQTPTSATGATYYAVWAKGSEDITAATVVNGYGNGSSLSNVSRSGTGAYTNQNPVYIKFDDTGDYIQFNLDYPPTSVSFDYKMVGGASTSTMTIQECATANGTYSKVEDLTISGTQNSTGTLSTTKSFSKSFVRMYFTKGSNVGIDNITIQGYTGGVSYSNYIAKCCTPLGAIKGAVELGQDDETGKLEAIWEMNSTDGLADNGIIIKIYKVTNNDADTTLVHTSAPLSKTAEDYTASNYTPDKCTKYFATLTTVHGGGDFCPGNVEQGESNDVTTVGYALALKDADGIPMDGETAMGLYSITGDLTNACAGTTISLGYMVEDGYHFESWDVYKTGESSTKVTVTNNQFTMPAYDVTVSAVFAANTSPSLTVLDGQAEDVTAVAFGNQEINTTSGAQTFTLYGENLTEGVAWALSGADADYFTVTPASPIAKATAESNDGQEMSIIFTPNAARNFSATLTFSSTGASNKVIALSGTGVELYTVTLNLGSGTGLSSTTDWTENAGVYTQKQGSYQGAITLPSATPSTDCNTLGWAFAGWATAEATSGDKPELISGSYSPTQNQTLYAVYAKENGYKLISSTDELTANDKYVLTSTYNYGNNEYALSSENGTSYATDAAGIDVTSKISQVGNAYYVNNPEAAYIWNFTGTTSAGQLFNESANKYIHLSDYDDTPILHTSGEDLTFAYSSNKWTIGKGSDYLRCYSVQNSDPEEIGFDAYSSAADMKIYKREAEYKSSPNCEVYELSSAVDPTGKGTVELSATSLAEGATATATYTITDEDYRFVNWTISGTGASIDDATANPVTITMGSADATITANFELIPTYTVTWNNNGSESTSTYKENVKPTFPATPVACDATSKVFCGWATANWSGKLDDLSEKTVYASETDILSAPNADVTYYAVFGAPSSETLRRATSVSDFYDGCTIAVIDNTKSQVLKNDLSRADAPAADANGYIAIDDIDTWTLQRNGANTAWNLYNGSKYLGAKSVPTSSYDDVELSNNNIDWTISANSTATNTFSFLNGATAGLQYYQNSGGTTKKWEISYNASVASSGNYDLIVYVPTLTDYMTTCCQKHNVTISNSIENGSVTASPISACADDEVTLTIAGDEGYELAELLVAGVDQKANVVENQYAFNMPSTDVAVSATFSKIAVTSVTFSESSNVQKDAQLQLSLTILPTTARPTIVWSTSDENKATVDQTGLVTGVAEGDVTITATVDNVAYTKDIHVTRATKLGSIEVTGTPKTTYTLNEAFVAPSVQANYLYADNDQAAYSEEVAEGVEFTGFDNQNAGNQTVTVSFGGKTTTYNVTVAPWTLHLQTKRMYGNDVETPSVADVTVNSLTTPIDLTTYYVSGLCEGYTQVGYVASSANVDALPNDLLTSYTPSANNETLYGVFKKTIYEGEELVNEDFSSITTTVTNSEISANDFAWLSAESKAYPNTGEVKLGSGSYAGSLTTNALDLSHAFVVKLKAQQYSSTEKTIQVTVGSTSKSETALTDEMVEYTFNFDAATSSSQVVISTTSSSKRAYVDDIQIYTLDDVAYMSVYDCREEKNITYDVVSEQATWTACEDATLMEGVSYTVCANEPTLQGYDFGGWIVNGDEENILAAGSQITVEADMALTAKWSAHIYDYHYDLSATATNGSITSVTVNGVPTELAAVELHDGDVVVVTATANTNYEFDSWTHSNNVAFSNEGAVATFTVNESAGDVTVAANFTEKAKYTITLNVFGRPYTTKQGYVGATYSSVIDGTVAPAVDGYLFQGWSTTEADNTDNLITGDEILTADVTLYAIIGISTPTGYVYNKVTSMSGITADGYYLIVNEAANKAFDGSRTSSSDLNSSNNYVTVEVNENNNVKTIISNATIDAAIVTFGEIENTDPQQHYIKTSTGYYIGASSSNGLNANKNTAYGVTLDFDVDGNFLVDGLCKNDKNNEQMFMFNNSSANRFGFYGGTQQKIQLYKRGAVHEDVLPEVEPTMEISSTVTASTTISGGYAGNMIINTDGTFNTDQLTEVNDLIIKTTLGKGTGTTSTGNAPGASGQITNAGNLTAKGDVYLEIELTQEPAASAGWYAFSVPFQVDALNGVYYGETKLTNEVGYAIMSHDGALRAENKYAWKKFRGIMQPGVFYVITVGNTDYKTLRFKKVADAALVASSSVPVSPFPSQTGNNSDGAWNGIGNPNLAISNLSTSVSTMQFYDHKTNSFIGRSHSVNLVVGSAFFIQYNAASTVLVPVGTTLNTGYLAPARTEKAVEDEIFQVSLVNTMTEEEEDNVFFTAREEATNSYEIGRDVAKLSMGAAKCAQMTIPAYGTNLCAADFPLVNDKSSYPLTITTPSAGDYRIELAEAYEDATIYLTYEGRVIWNLSMSPYEIELQQGQTEGYGLRLVAAPKNPTDIENTEAINGANGVQKVIIDEHVYILRGEQLFDVTGKAAR